MSSEPMYTSKKNTWMKKQRYGLKQCPDFKGKLFSTFPAGKPPLASANLCGTNWAFFEDHLVYEDGKWKKIYCFLMILGYSRMRYIEFVTDMSTNTLIRCHQNAFWYFGGYPEEILYDNMKQVVIKRLLKQEDSTLNRHLRTLRVSMDLNRFCADHIGGKQRGKSKEQFILSVTIL